MQVTCPTCKKVSNSKADLSGKQVKCSCGHSFVVPKVASAATQASDASAPAASNSIAVKCECGKGHRVPEAAAGKAIKCSCGKVIRIPAKKAATGATPQQNLQAAAPLNPFHALSDADWAKLKPKEPPKPDPFAEPKKPSATSSMLTQARADLGEKMTSTRSGAGSHLAQSRWILIGNGVLKLALCIYQMVDAERNAFAIVDGSEGLSLDDVMFAIQVIAGFGIGVSIAMILMGVFVFLMPMTCSISAVVMFVLLELISFVFYPLLLFNIRAWIVRGAMFGALIQAINNASYYKFVKSGARD